MFREDLAACPWSPASAPCWRLCRPTRQTARGSWRATAPWSAWAKRWSPCSAPGGASRCSFGGPTHATSVNDICDSLLTYLMGAGCSRHLSAAISINDQNTSVGQFIQMLRVCIHLWLCYPRTFQNTGSSHLAAQLWFVRQLPTHSSVSNYLDTLLTMGSSTEHRHPQCWMQPVWCQVLRHPRS
jgi:hypothetical protein